MSERQQQGAGYRGSSGTGARFDHKNPPTTTAGWLRAFRDFPNLEPRVEHNDFSLLPPGVQARLRANQAEYKLKRSKWGDAFGDALNETLTNEGRAAVVCGVVDLKETCCQILEAYEEQAASIEGMFPTEYQALRDRTSPPSGPSLLNGKGVLRLVGHEKWGVEVMMTPASIKPIRRVARPPGNPDALKVTNADVAEYAASLCHSDDARKYARKKPPTGSGLYSVALKQAVAARFGLTTRQVDRKLRAADFHPPWDLWLGTGRSSSRQLH